MIIGIEPSLAAQHFGLDAGTGCVAANSASGRYDAVAGEHHRKGIAGECRTHSPRRSRSADFIRYVTIGDDATKWDPHRRRQYAKLKFSASTPIQYIQVEFCRPPVERAGNRSTKSGDRRRRITALNIRTMYRNQLSAIVRDDDSSDKRPCMRLIPNHPAGAVIDLHYG